MVIPRKRNGYYYIGEREYPSVTKILGDTLNKPALLYWFGREATRIALKDPTLNEKEVLAQVQLITKQSQSRGKTVHSYAEFKTGYSQKQPDITGHEGYCRAFDSWFSSVSPHTLGNEIEIHSKRHGYAGRCDYICKINDEAWLVDFKTGKSIYREVGLQLAAYRHALAEMDTIEVAHTGVVLLMETGEFQFKETKDNVADFLNVMRVWEWLKRRDE